MDSPGIRLQSFPASGTAAAGIAREAALALYSSAIDLIIHLDGSKSGNRIAEICELEK